MMCVCGDRWIVHMHYRAGSDCAFCRCPRFVRHWPWRRWIDFGMRAAT